MLRYFLGGYGFRKKVLFTEPCFSSYCCQSPNVHCDLKGESLELVACTMTKGIQFSFLFFSRYIFSLVYSLGGGDCVKKCDFP